jgi:hypothetical protein
MLSSPPLRAGISRWIKDTVGFAFEREAAKKMVRPVNVFTILQVIRIENPVTIITVRDVHGRHHFVVELRVVIIVGTVHGVHDFFTVVHERTVLQLLHIKTVVAILCVVEVIAKRMFIVLASQRDSRGLVLECSDSRFQLFSGQSTGQFHFFKVSFAIVTLVKNVIFLPSQTHTPKTVIGTNHVETVLQVTSILAILTASTVVTTVTVHAVVTQFAVETVVAVHRILRIVEKVAVVAILVMLTSNKKIAIFRIARKIHIRTVFTIHLHEGDPGMLEAKCFQLLKNSHGKVK